jgi:hypothetical protein
VERVHDGPRHLPRQDGEHVPRTEGQLQPQFHRPGVPRQHGGHQEEGEDEARSREPLPRRGRRHRPRRLVVGCHPPVRVDFFPRLLITRRDGEETCEWWWCLVCAPCGEGEGAVRGRSRCLLAWLMGLGPWGDLVGFESGSHSGEAHEPLSIGSSFHRCCPAAGMKTNRWGNTSLVSVTIFFSENKTMFGSVL